MWKWSKYVILCSKYNVAMQTSGAEFGSKLTFN